MLSRSLLVFMGDIVRALQPWMSSVRADTVASLIQSDGRVWPSLSTETRPARLCRIVVSSLRKCIRGDDPFFKSLKPCDDASGAVLIGYLLSISRRQSSWQMKHFIDAASQEHFLVSRYADAGSVKLLVCANLPSINTCRSGADRRP